MISTRVRFFRDDAAGKSDLEVASNDGKVLLNKLLLCHDLQDRVSLQHDAMPKRRECGKGGSRRRMVEFVRFIDSSLGRHHRMINNNKLAEQSDATSSSSHLLGTPPAYLHIPRENNTEWRFYENGTHLDLWGGLLSGGLAMTYAVSHSPCAMTHSFPTP